MSGQTRQNAPSSTSTSTSTDLANPSVGSENSVANTSLNQTSTDSGTPTLDLAGGETTRPPKMTFKYNESLLLSSKDPVIAQICNQVITYQRTQLKDGVELTPEEVLCLAVGSMWKSKVDIVQQRIVLYQLFYGGHSPGYMDDSIYTIVPRGGGVTLTFGGADNIEPATFTGPTAYVGIDTNKRESQVQAAKNGYRVGGYRVAAGPGSIMTKTTPQFLIGFQASPSGAAFRDVDFNDLEQTPGFNEALLAYRHEVFMYSWLARAQYLTTERIKEVVGDPPNPATADWITAAVGTSVDFLTTLWDDPNWLASPHAVITPEDEAVIQNVIAKLCPGVKVNLDADANGGRGNIQITGLKGGTAEPAAPAKEVDPATARIIAANKTMGAIDAHRRGIEKNSYANVLDAGQTSLYYRLPEESKALWNTFDFAAHASRWQYGWKLTDSDELGVYGKFLTAWYTLADTLANDGKTEAPQAALDAAVSAFKGYA